MRITAEMLEEELRAMAEEADPATCACCQWTPGYICDGHMAAISLEIAERRIKKRLEAPA